MPCADADDRKCVKYLPVRRELVARVWLRAGISSSLFLTQMVTIPTPTRPKRHRLNAIDAA